MKRIYLFLPVLLSAVQLLDQNDSLPASDFLISATRQGNTVRLTCDKGCAWSELNFTLLPYGVQAINAAGMTELVTEEQAADHPFYFVLRRTKEGFELNGLAGTAWESLAFSHKDWGGPQYINQMGMVAR